LAGATSSAPVIFKAGENIARVGLICNAVAVNPRQESGLTRPALDAKAVVEVIQAGCYHVGAKGRDLYASYCR
jgi:hypothetical protein